MADKTSAQEARDAVVYSLVSNAVQLLLMLGVTVAIAKRDEIVRLGSRLERAVRKDDGNPAERRALAEFRRDLSLIEHWMNRKDRRGADSHAEPSEPSGGLYGQG